MKQYYESIGMDPFASMPVTFHIKAGLSDPEFSRFTHYHLQQKHLHQVNSVWIIKPGEDSNQGRGINITGEFKEISTLVKDLTQDSKHTCILQRYITKPLLLSKRKFDIRTFGMLTSINGNLKGFAYEDGYLKTSSALYE